MTEQPGATRQSLSQERRGYQPRPLRLALLDNIDSVLQALRYVLAKNGDIESPKMRRLTAESVHCDFKWDVPMMLLDVRGL